MDLHIFDSNIWIALLLEHDTQHERAVTLFYEHKESTIGIPEYIWLEVSTVLSIKGDKATANTFLHMVMNTENVVPLYMDEAFSKKVHDFFMTTNYAHLSYVDHTLLFLARHTPVHTFDEQLHKAIALKSSVSDCACDEK